MKKLTERFYMWLAWILPERLVLWCAVRVLSFATSGEYSNTVVSELKAMDALDVWIKAFDSEE